MNLEIEQQIDAHIAKHKERILEELSGFCSQPSISAQGIGMRGMVVLVQTALQRRGFEVEIHDTPGAPIIMATHPGSAPRWLLCYNHYDVQPIEPLEAWTYPPFSLTQINGKLYARGVMDDKGHIVCRLAAIDAVKAVTGSLPLGICFIIEGEEEVQSPNLEDFVHQQAPYLHPDLCLWEFGDVDEDGVPTQYLGFRGILYVELTVETAEIDAHSGIAGSVLPNAAWRLIWALESLKSHDERVRIPGFYDDILPPSPLDMELFNRLPDASMTFKRAFGATQLLSGLEKPGFLHQTAVLSPSCTICGLSAGYQGPGAKTVLPAHASAKVDFRLVPDQDPEDILHKLRCHLDVNGFGDVRITCLGREKPARTDPRDPYVALVVEAARDVYGQPQRVYPMSGGSGPAHVFLEALGVPIVTVGIGYPGSRIHAPDENIRIVDLLNATRHTARIITRMAEVERR